MLLVLCLLRPTQLLQIEQFLQDKLRLLVHHLEIGWENLLLQEPAVRVRQKHVHVRAYSVLDRVPQLVVR